MNSSGAPVRQPSPEPFEREIPETYALTMMTEHSQEINAS